LATFSQAIANGSHRPAGTLGKCHKTKQRIRSPAGIAITAPPRLKEAVTKVCGVRRKHPGKVTALLRQTFAEHTLLADAVRKSKHEADKEKKARLHHNKGVTFNINMEEPLARTEDELKEHMLMLGNAIGTCKAYLKRQFDARVARANVDEFNYPGIGPIFRDKAGKKLKKTPSTGEDHVEYLKKLVLLMMKADSRRNSAMHEAPSLVGLVRQNPVIDPGSTDPRSQRAKSAQELTIGHQARQVDDPWLVQLEKDYLGKLCFLHDISMRHKLYRICKISYWPSSRSRNACWEATMEPIHVRHDGAFDGALEIFTSLSLSLTRDLCMTFYL
jgi:hypothetical protein